MAIALFAAPAAEGKDGEGVGKLKTRSGTVAITGTSSLGTAVATCPKGTRALSGGYSATPPSIVNAPVQLALIYESRRLSARSWQASAAQLGPGSSTLTAYAYCAKDFGKVKERSVSVALPTPSRSEATSAARCPKGSRAISGGFQVPALTTTGRLVFITDHEMLGSNSWQVNGVRSAVDADPGQVVAFVYCASGADAAKVKTATTSVVTAAGAERFPVAITGRCGKPLTAVGGGFRAPYATSGVNRETTFVTESRRSGRSWQVAGFAPGGNGLTLNLTALGYCR